MGSLSSGEISFSPLRHPFLTSAVYVSIGETEDGALISAITLHACGTVVK